MLAGGVSLYHVRHGETAWNAEGRLQGRSDTPMNARGLEQARRNGEALARHFADEGVDAAALDWVASPLSRARRTMEIVREAMGLPSDGYRVDERLLEVDFGGWSGFTLAEIEAAGHGAGVKARKRDKWGFRPPGGESYADMALRVGAVLEAIRADTVAVSHGGVYRTIHGLVVGTPREEVPVLHARQDRVARFRDGRHIWI